MKYIKIIIIIALSFCFTQLINGQTDNYSTTNTGFYSSALGMYSNANGMAAFASGYGAQANGNFSHSLGSYCVTYANNTFACGSNSKAKQTNSIAMGLNTVADGSTAIAIGKYVKAKQANSIIIGNGYSSTYMVNAIENSMAIGFNSDIPTFFIGSSDGLGTIGKVGIGTTDPQFELDVAGDINCKVFSCDEFDGIVKCNGLQAYYHGIQSMEITDQGKIWAREIRVRNVNPYADFVFEDDYSLMTLAELENYIKQYKHLPDVPTTADVEVDGLNIGKMNVLLLQKVEELTLYVINLNNKINELEEKLERSQESEGGSSK